MGNNVRSRLLDGGDWDDDGSSLAINRSKSKPKKKPINVSDPFNLKQLVPKNITLTGTTEAIEIRQKFVRKFMARGHGAAVIAGALDVSQATIERDVRDIRKASSEKAQHGNEEAKVGDILATYKAIEEEALENLSNCDPGSAEANAFLSTALRATTAIAKLHLDSGRIEKAPDKVISESEIKTIQDMSGTEAERMAEEVTKEIADQLAAIEALREELAEESEDIVEDDSQ